MGDITPPNRTRDAFAQHLVAQGCGTGFEDAVFLGFTFADREAFRAAYQAISRIPPRDMRAITFDGFLGKAGCWIISSRADYPVLESVVGSPVFSINGSELSALPFPPAHQSYRQGNARNAPQTEVTTRPRQTRPASAMPDAVPKAWSNPPNPTTRIAAPPTARLAAKTKTSPARPAAPALQWPTDLLQKLEGDKSGAHDTAARNLRRATLEDFIVDADNRGVSPDKIAEALHRDMQAHFTIGDVGRILELIERDKKHWLHNYVNSPSVAADFTQGASLCQWEVGSGRSARPCHQPPAFGKLCGRHLALSALSN